MPVLSDLNTTWTEKTQRDDTFQARAALESCTNAIDECHQTIQALVDSGSFGTIPDDLKDALNDWWAIVKTARTSIGADGDIMDVYNWRP